MAGQLWHTIRNPDGTWQRFFGLIEGQEANNPGSFVRVSCTAVGSALHIVGIVNGQLWHTIRNADGTWQTELGLVESHEVNNPGPFSRVGCAGVGTDLHVVGLVNGQLWHTIRNAAGTWQTEFGLVESVSHAPNPFGNVSCTALGDALHIAALSGGALYHTIRDANGNWQPEFDAYSPPNPPPPIEISCAGVGNELQVVAASDDGNLYHTLWAPGPVWQPTWGLVENEVAQPNRPEFGFTYVGCSGITDALHVVAMGAERTEPFQLSLWHTIRFYPGNWQPTFDDVNGEVPQNDPQINITSCAAVGTSLHIVGVDT